MTEIISVKQTSVQEARDRIEEYLKQHQGPAYPSEIADHYGLELEPTFEAIKQLIAEGKTKETKTETLWKSSRKHHIHNPQPQPPLFIYFYSFILANS